MMWWDIRPAHCKFPTLEMRVTDICTRLDDALARWPLMYACILSHAAPGCAAPQSALADVRRHVDPGKPLAGAALWFHARSH